MNKTTKILDKEFVPYEQALEEVLDYLNEIKGNGC